VSAGAERRLSMGKAARAHVAAHYTVDKMCADTLALYRALLTPPRPRLGARKI